MKTRTCLIAGGVWLFGYFAPVHLTSAGQLSAHYALRDGIHVDGPSLSASLKRASQWGLRKSRHAKLRKSLVYSPDSATSSGIGLRGFLGASLQRSDSLRATLHSSNANHFAARAAIYQLLPTLSFSTQINRQGTTDLDRNIRTNFEDRSASLNAEWTVFSSGANWANIRAARSTALATDLNYLATERQIFFQNTGVYLQLYTSRKVVRAISGTLRRLKRVRFSTYMQFKAGLTSRSDVAEVDAEIASVQSQLEAARQTLEEQNIAFIDLVGYAPPKRITDPKVSHLVPKTRKAAIDRALNNNHLIGAAVANQQAAYSNSLAVRGQLLPQISLFASATANEPTYDSSVRDNDWSFGARLTVPLVDLSTSARYMEAREQSVSAAYQTSDTRRRIRNEVETSWTNYHSLLRQSKASKRQTRAIRRSLKGIRAQVDIGLRPITDLLREEIRLTESQISEIQTDLNIRASAYRLAVQFSDLPLSQIAPI